MASRRPAGLPGIDSLIPPTADEDAPQDNTVAAAEQAPAAGQRATRSAAKPAAAKTGKDKMSGFVAIDVLEATKDVVWQIPGMSMGSFLEEAARREIKRLEKVHNDGQPFTPRPEGEHLRPGPRIR